MNGLLFRRCGLFRPYAGVRLDVRGAACVYRGMQDAAQTLQALDDPSGHLIRSRELLQDLRERILVTQLVCHLSQIRHGGGYLCRGSFEAKLFVAAGPPRPPDWLRFLREGFATLSAPRTRSLAAVLVVRFTHGRQADMMAFTFGAGGRFLLRAGSWERSFGLRTALNLIFEGDDGSEMFDASRLRSIDFKRVQANTVRLREQANRGAPLETFDFDIRRDLLSRVFGPPADADTWGARVGGADALYLTHEVDFAGVGDLCVRILRARNRRDYRKRFAWVDNIQFVDDERDLRRLEGEVVSRITGGLAEEFTLAPPDLLDWERIRGFQFSGDRRKRDPGERPVRLDPDLEEYLRQLGGDASNLDAQSLRKDSLWAVDAEGRTVGRWKVWDCLATELTLGERTFILDEGSFYEIAHGYRAEIDGYLDAIPEWTGTLPPARKGVPEADYNRLAASSATDYLLMDRELMRAPGTTSVEICDLLVSDGTLVHVKKGLASAALSHLFSQGAVSAELLLEEEFRRLAVERIESVAMRLSRDAAGWGETPCPINADRALTPGSHLVVFAMLGSRKGGPLSGRLPFFSKVNLRANVDRLHRLGFPVHVARIELGPRSTGTARPAGTRRERVPVS